MKMLFERAYRNLAELGLAEWEKLKPAVEARHEEGDARATFILGVAADDGIYGKRDRALAQELYERAAEKGDPSAMVHLGLLVRGKSKTRAKALFDQAAALGHGQALFQRGKMERTPHAARPFWVRAADAGDVAAMVALAEIADRAGADDARDLWVRAAEAGSPMALVTAVGRLLEGRGGPKDPARARKLLDKHAFPERPYGPTGGEPDCQWWYAEMLARGEGGKVDRVLAAFYCTILVRAETEHARKAKKLLAELTTSLDREQLAEIEQRIADAPYDGVKVLARP